MRRARRALYVLPLLVAGVTILAIWALGAFGAECHGRLLEGTYECNSLGEAQDDLFYAGLALTAVSIVVWVLGMLGIGIRLLVRRRRARLN